MLLATTKVEDFDRFMKVFSAAGAEKRKQHGSKGALIFRDPVETDRVWVVFDWDQRGWESFVSDPEVPPIMKEAGHKSKPQAAQLAGQCPAGPWQRTRGAGSPWLRVSAFPNPRPSGRQNAPLSLYNRVARDREVQA